jgi:hypothetical protein
MKNKFLNRFLKFSVISTLAFAVAFSFAGATTLRELTRIFINEDVIPSENVTEAWNILDELEASAQNSLACGPFTRDLTIGAQGLEVSRLQNFLRDAGFLVIPPGIGTGYFGSLTQSSLARYQNSVAQSSPNTKIERNGYFGASTRLHLRSVCSGSKDSTSSDAVRIDVEFATSTVTSLSDDDGNDTGTFQITFDVTAIGDTIYIPDTAQVASSTVPVTGRDEIQYLIYRSGTFEWDDLADTVTFTTPEGVTDSTNNIKIEDGATSRVTVTVSKSNNESSDGGIYQMKLIGIPWDTDDTSNYSYMKALRDFETGTVFLSGSGNNQKSNDDNDKSKTPVKVTTTSSDHSILISKLGIKNYNGAIYTKYAVTLRSNDRGGKWALKVDKCSESATYFFGDRFQNGHSCFVGTDSPKQSDWVEANSFGDARVNIYVRSLQNKDGSLDIGAIKADGNGENQKSLETKKLNFEGTDELSGRGGFVANVFAAIGSALKRVLFGS